mmetsp:Transcript_21413/g.55124  ORF Transcript_21413/g.55124 Transcript_21413/m.55124 type:complete len:217 (-) Transcript_21413:1354-2004(-)
MCALRLRLLALMLSTALPVASAGGDDCLWTDIASGAFFSPRDGATVWLGCGVASPPNHQVECIYSDIGGWSCYDRVTRRRASEEAASTDHGRMLGGTAGVNAGYNCRVYCAGEPDWGVPFRRLLVDNPKRRELTDLVVADTSFTCTQGAGDVDYWHPTVGPGICSYTKHPVAHAVLAPRVAFVTSLLDSAASTIRYKLKRITDFFGGDDDDDDAYY